MLNDLLREIGNYVYPACLLTVLLCIMFLFIHEPNARTKLLDLWRHRKRAILFLFYFAFLMMATVFGRQTTRPYNSIFKHLFFKIDDAEWNKEIIENTLVFIPLTFLFLISFSKRLRKPYQSAVLLAFATSMFIELSQLVFWLGEFQFADILYNTIGGLFGLGTWRIYCYISKAFQNGK